MAEGQGTFCKQVKWESGTAVRVVKRRQHTKKWWTEFDTVEMEMAVRTQTVIVSRSARVRILGDRINCFGLRCCYVYHQVEIS